LDQFQGVNSEIHAAFIPKYQNDLMEESEASVNFIKDL